MKKIISIILALALVVVSCFAMTSCQLLDMFNPSSSSEEETPQTPKKVQIGVQAGTTGEYFVNGDVDWDFEGIAGYEAKGYQNPGLAVNDMLNGNVKYVVVDQQPALRLAANQAFSGAIKVVDIPLTVEEYAFGVDKGQDDLLLAINEILADMKTNGKLAEIVDKYATGEGIVPVTSAEFDISKASTQLVVATSANFAPFEYKEGNQFAGIDMEIIALIAAELDLEVVIKDMEFDAVVTSVGKNGIDIAVSGLTVNETRKESVDFSETYYNAAQMLIVAESNTSFDNCKTADDVVAKLEELAK